MIKIKEFFQKSISLVLGVAIVSLALSFWAMAWTEPAQNPPDGNAQSPLNVGDTGQVKQGWLSTLESLWVGLEPSTPGEGKSYAGLLRVLKGALINENGSQYGLIVATGSVGLGTTDPAAGFRMEVNGNIKLTGTTPTFKVTNVASPIADSDVATRGYVDDKLAVLDNSNLSSNDYVYAAENEPPPVPPESCAYRLRYKGYAGSFNGNLGGPQGAAQKCANAFPSLNTPENHIHWCSAKELNDLGLAYTYASEAWVRDAVLGVADLPAMCGGFYTIYGGSGYATTSKDEDDATCWAWLSPSSGFVGPVMKTSGGLGVAACNLSKALPCCYYGNN